MNLQEEYQLSLYQDLGKLEGLKNIRLKRNTINGVICVEKHVPANMKYIYQFLKSNPTKYTPVIYECVELDDELIIMEEYIDGNNLEELVNGKTFTEGETVKIIYEICNALSIFHSANPPIIYRDLKAENIMINVRRELKLVDFDIARTYQTGKCRDTELLGTAEYAAPEQFGYFQTDNRTDIYALGVLINYISTGCFPVEKMVSGRLGQIVKKCTYMDPKERYQSVEHLMRHLQKLFPEGEFDYKGENGSGQSESWTIPGFRSGNLWNSLIGTGGYLFISFLCFGMTITSEKVVLPEWLIWFEKFVIWFSQILFIFIVCNYRNIRSKVALLNHRNIVVRVIGYVITEYALLFIIAILCSMAEYLLV